MLEGVTVDRMRSHPSGYATITMKIANSASIARLASWAANTNVTFFVWCHPFETADEECRTTDEEWASPDRVRYELRGGTNPRGSPDSPSNMQLLCGHLIEYLAAREILAGADANRLLSSCEDLGFGPEE